MPTKIVLTPGQCRAARGFLDWTQEALAEQAAVSRGTVRDFEKGHHALHRSTERLLVETFQAAGVVFVTAEGGGPGVLLPGPAAASTDAATIDGDAGPVQDQASSGRDTARDTP